MKATALIKGGFWIAIGTFTKRFFALLSNLVLARLLSPADFGVISVAYIFWSLIVLFTQGSTGLFVLYKGIGDRRYLDTIHTLGFIIGAVFASGLAIASPWISQFFNEPNLTGILYLYAFNLLFSSIYYVYEAILIRKEQYREVTVDTFIASILRLIVTAICAFMGLRYWSFALGDTIFWLTNLLLAIWQSRCLLRFRISRSIFSEVMTYCLGTVGSSVGFYANLNLDNFVVGKLLGSTSLGYYSLAYQLTMAITKIFNPVIDRLGTPAFAKLPGDQEQKQALVKLMERLAFWATPIYALLLLSLDRTVVTFLFGNQWVSIVDIIPWLIISAYCRSLNSPLKSMMAAKGLPSINARVNLQIAPIAVLSFMIGAYQGGILGVSIAVAIVLGLAWTVYWWWAACRSLGWSIKDFWLPYLLPMAITLASLLIAFSLPIVLKQIAFLLSYTVFVRLFTPKKFDEHFSNLTKIAFKQLKIRLSYRTLSK